MKKRILIVFLLWISHHGFAQFNTVKYESKLKSVAVTDTDIGYSIKADSIKGNELSLNPTARNNNIKIAPQSASMPLGTPLINSAYGSRIDPFQKRNKMHYGMDFQASSDSVLSILPGVIQRIGNDKNLGNYIEISHGDFSSIYGHLSTVEVKKGIFIGAGEFLGITGTTGKTTGEHLHFAMKHLGNLIDPEPILDHIFELIETVKSDFSSDIEAVIRNRNVQ